MSVADAIGSGLEVAGQLLRLVVTIADAAKRPDIAKPVKEILAKFGKELNRAALSEAELAANGDGSPPHPDRALPDRE